MFDLWQVGRGGGGEDDKAGVLRDGGNKVNWIDVKKKLPKDQQIVLAKSKKSELGYSVLKLHCQPNENMFWFDDCLGIQQIDDVTEWMPLSELIEVQE